MTRLISLKIEEGELRKVDHSAQTVGVSRNAYINKALRFFNHLYEKTVASYFFSYLYFFQFLLPTKNHSCFRKRKNALLRMEVFTVRGIWR
mgnify:CR=1 FL=1